MAGLQEIQSRRKAVRNIGAITKAMEVVSATKMRRAQAVALASRPYAFAALSTLADLLTHAPEHLLETSQFIRRSVATSTLLVLVASDKGLAGSFNNQIERAAGELIKGGGDYRLVVVGKKLAGWASRSGLPVERVFTNFGDYAEAHEVAPLSRLIAEGFLAGRFGRVLVISTHFHTTLKQSTVTREILPMHIDLLRETVREIVPEHGRFSEYRERLEAPSSKHDNAEYIFEPSAIEVLDTLLPHLLSMQVLHLLLEANASEHSARMVAMKNARENASELTDSLNLEYNKARQSAITKEMIEISSAIV